MAYNPYFQTPYYQQPPIQGIIWIQGRQAALAYPVGAGQSVILMDSDAPYVYKKETDQNGRPMPMETFKLVKEDAAQVEPLHESDLKGYVKADEIEDIVREEVERRLSELSFKPTRKRNTEE